MPSSLKLVLALLLFGALAAPVAIAVLIAQDEAQARVTAEQITGGHADAGKQAIGRYGCGGCHAIPGLNSADGRVGPPLNHMGQRVEIAGVLANNPGNMIRWLQHPQAVVPGNGMPDQPMSDRDARDIAAYLYALRR